MNKPFFFFLMVVLISALAINKFAATSRSSEKEVQSRGKSTSPSEQKRIEEWPRWRGPRGDGTWNGPQFPKKWPEDGLEELWSRDIGGGYAGITVAQDRVYTLDYQTEPKEAERVLCFSAQDGKLLWSHKYEVKYGDLQYGNGPRAAPTFHQGMIYTLGSLGHLHCLDAKTGQLQWSRHLIDDLNGRLSTWGYAASPFVYRDLLIVMPGGEDDASIVGLDRKTGELVWSSLSDKAGYATPILICKDGVEQLICWTPTHVRSLDPQTGKPFWKVPYKVTYGVAIATPIFRENIVFVSGYWEGSKAIRLGREPSQATLDWENERKLRGLMSQPLYRDGYVYLLDKSYGLTCFELKTGKILWDNRDHRLTPRGRNPQASIVWLNGTDRIVALNSDGELVLARLSPEGYQEQSRTKIIGETWAHPAFAKNRVFARSNKRIVCMELPRVESSASAAQHPSAEE